MTHRQFIQREGFTLVELLVVVGIIAILISFLLPALNRARDSAKTVACLSNLKQLGMAMFSYANDNHGWTPIAKYSKAAGTAPVTTTNIDRTWEEQLLPYIDDKFKTIDTPNLGQLTDRAHSILFGCPIWMEIWQRSGGPPIVGTDPARNVGYGLNLFPKAPASFGGFSGPGGTLASPADINWFEPDISRFGRAFRLTEWTNPSARAMFGDCHSPQMYVNPPSGIVPGTTTIDVRHSFGRFTNILFWDGSASSLLIADARYSVRFINP